MEVLFLIFWTTSMPFSTMAVPFWILTNSRQGFQFPHILASSCYILGIFLVHPTCTWWVGWGFFSPHPPSEVKTNKGLWSIPSCTQDLKASSSSDKSSYCSYFIGQYGRRWAILPCAYEEGSWVYLVYQHSWWPHVLIHYKPLRRGFHFIITVLQMKSLMLRKKQWFVRWFLSGRVGTGTQPSFYPCCNSTKCWETPDTCSRQACLSTCPPAYCPQLCAVLFPAFHACALSLSQPHVLPVSRVVLLQRCISRSQATGGQG